MSISREKLIRAAFRSMPGIGSQRLRQLIAMFGSAELAWEAAVEQSELWVNNVWLMNLAVERQQIDLDLIEEDLAGKGIFLVTPEDDYYPRLLAELSDAPPLLYYRGSLFSQAEGLAVVGSRQATAYGRAAADFLAREAVHSGLIVVSGLARGIDTAAHQGALAAGGQTWAFLGCGVDVIYPRENQRLVAQIIENGAVLSEFEPGTPPEAAHFPARNRLISGCARGVVVVEAGIKSGAMITVDFALEQGREVFAVPGPIFSELSRGTHHLLRSGAKIVEGIADITAEIPAWGQVAVARTHLHTHLNDKDMENESERVVQTDVSEQQTVLDILSDVPLHIDQVAIKCCSLSPEELPLALLELQLAGKIEQLPGQRYVLARRC